jgi:hypothetical protein
VGLLQGPDGGRVMDKAELRSFVYALASWWSPAHRDYTKMSPGLRTLDPKLADLLDKHDAAIRAVADYAQARLECK